MKAFLCDSMLGGLARWLRAFGHYAYWVRGIDDSELVRFAVRKGLFLLTSDTGIMRRGVVRSGRLPALYVPAGQTKKAQFVFAVQSLKLKKREPLCMACAGELVRVDKEMNRSDIPPKTYLWLDEFYRCANCNKLFWKGTHWHRVDKALDTAARPERR